MPTYTAFTTLSGRDSAEALGLAMERLDPEPSGVGVFELEDESGLWEIGGYFTQPPDETALAVLAAAFGARDFAVSALPETDWVARVKRTLSPVSAGRFHVYGSHDADSVPAGVEPLLIEASMAFGTGHHGTTLGCLRALDRLANDGFRASNAIDVGCGTAVLAMAAARLWPEHVLASDIDAVAVEVARANVEANGLSDRVTCLEAMGFDHPRIESAAPYDLIFANILKGPLVALAPAMAERLLAGGHAILSGILNPQAPEVIATYERLGMTCKHHDEIAEWSTLTLCRSRN